MRSLVSYIQLVIVLLLPYSLMGADTLSLQTYLEVVRTYHPLIQKANLYDEVQAAYRLKGSGALDPKINSNYQTKDFEKKDYFTVWQSEAKIPTKLPVDFSVGYERNDGIFLNPENTVPSNGLVYGTINVNLLKGLLFDEQRFQLQQADLKGLKSQIEKELLVREVLHQAVLAYLEWAAANNQLVINETYRNLLNVRHLNVVNLFLNGDIPAIDTTESRLNINTADKLMLNARDKVMLKQQKLSLFIWDAAGNPLQVNTALNAMQLSELVEVLQELSKTLSPNFSIDPYIRKIDNEIGSLELVNRLEKENLKPQLNLKYNTILALGDGDFDPSFTLRDYKYGVSFEYPIRNRKSKGEIKLNEILMNQNALDRQQYLGKLSNQYDGLLVRLQLQSALIVVAEDKIRNSDLLYEAEQLKFGIGESSIFLLNKRELKLLEAQGELIKTYESVSKILNDLYYIKLGQ